VKSTIDSGDSRSGLRGSLDVRRVAAVAEATGRLAVQHRFAADSSGSLVGSIHVLDKLMVFALVVAVCILAAAGNE
jgi:hypothetical protein